MRKIISILLLSILFSACKSEQKQTPERDGYIIEGNAPGVYNGIRAYLEVPTDRGRKIALDTAIVMNEKFVFEGKTDYPEMVTLKVNSARGEISFVLENKAMTVDLVDAKNIQGSKVIGTEANKALNLYNDKSNELTEKRFGISRQLRSVNKEDQNINVGELESALSDLTNEMKDYPFKFIAENKDNIFSVLLLKRLSESKNADFDRIESTLNTLSDANKTSIPATILKTNIQTKKIENNAIAATQIGAIAPKFSAPAPDGKLLALDDVKGKLTLIDFWASWCRPCRKENPNVVKVYNKYHKDGLEIISVSLDGTRSQKDPKAAWLKAIEDDKLTWNHVSNLQYFNDPVARSYNIKSIPATFLLDENGTIVAKNLRGDALEKAVAEHLK